MLSSCLHLLITFTLSLSGIEENGLRIGQDCLTGTQVEPPFYNAFCSGPATGRRAGFCPGGAVSPGAARPHPGAVINGPLPPGVYVPSRLNTFADRKTQCIDQGTSYGLHGRKLNSYAQRCSNVH
jgi:hypothetical protein